MVGKQSPSSGSGLERAAGGVPMLELEQACNALLVKRMSGKREKLLWALENHHDTSP